VRRARTSSRRHARPPDSCSSLALAARSGLGPRSIRPRTPTRPARTDPLTGRVHCLGRAPRAPGSRHAGRRRPEGHRHRSACYWDGRDQGISKPPPGPVPCSSPDGYWSNGYHCYISPVDPSRLPAIRAGRATSPATARSTTATSRRPDCSSRSGRRIRRPTRAAGPTPREVAQLAIEQMNSVGHQHRHRPEPGPDSVGLVGMPVWMWAKAPTTTPSGQSRHPHRLAASRSRDGEGPSRHLGHGRRHRGRLRHGGTPYKPSYGRKDSPDCGHTYKKSSADEADGPSPSPLPRAGSSPGRARARAGPSGSTV
jgi:hypothetical protein